MYFNPKKNRMYKRLKIEQTPKERKPLPRITTRFFKRLKFNRKSNVILLDKRQRFAVQTIILTAGVLITQLIWQDARFYMVGLLALTSYLLTAWSLREDIKGNEWFLLFILPVLFTASLSLFYFLLPGRWIIRLTTTVIFAVGTYAILLIENIYNVAAQRTIQLLRAAQSVGLLLTLLVIFLSSNIVYSLRLPFYFNFMLPFIFSFLLGLQSLWSINLNKKLDGQILIYSLLVGGGVGELSLVLSFWPINNPSYSLILSSAFYTIVGIVQSHFSERLFKNVIREYLTVFAFTFILMFLITKWG